ncbi:MAG: DUF1566 domain-containing protein [Campylobacterota bacterium]|nr:DUF1566 domain-containing protein [Campylobacterota bacterium]
MKKLLLTSFMVISSVLLIAGGDVKEELPEVTNIPNNVCNSDTVYIQKDVTLMWQDAKYGDIEDGAYKRENSGKKAGSLNYAKNYCQGLNYNGYRDWRLPTSDELMSVHRISGQVFKNFREGDFWTSTPAESKKYYVVLPADAYRYKRSVKQSNYIRCVRCLDKDEVK